VLGISTIPFSHVAAKNSYAYYAVRIATAILAIAFGIIALYLGLNALYGHVARAVAQR